MSNVEVSTKTEVTQKVEPVEDHVEYDLLVVNVFSAPITLKSVAIVDGAVGERCASQERHSRRPSRCLTKSAEDTMQLCGP